MHNVTAEFFEDGVLLKYDNWYNTISYDELSDLINVDTSKFESHILPINCVKFIQTKSHIKLVLFHPAKKFNAHIDEDVFENCIRPNIIIFFDVEILGNGYKILSTKMFGTNDEFYQVNNDTQIFAIPFPNINDDGWICWGSNVKVNEIKSLTQLHMFADRFFALKFNNDLWNHSFMGARGIGNVKEMFLTLKGQEKFPSSYLIPIAKHNTLIDQLNFI